MRTEKNSKNIGKGLSRSAFEDDGIPNSPFKSSKSAALTFAIFGIVFGGLFVVCGATMAISQSAKNAPTQIVQPIRATAPGAATKVAIADGGRKQLHINQTHAIKPHTKKHAKAKSGHQSKS